MDSTNADLTVRVVGTRGEAAVLVRGYDCFEIEIVFQGAFQGGAAESICS
jgi:hypothetical protein